ncbi:MAG: DoxX family protein [Microthrixaceae bacterium]
MFIAAVIVSVLLAFIAASSAAMKLQRHPQVVAAINGTVGVPMERLPVLAMLELAGALGLIIGLWVTPIGVAAATGLFLYFLGAVIAHVRVGDTKGVRQPVLPLVLSVAAIILLVVSG